MMVRLCRKELALVSTRSDLTTGAVSTMHCNDRPSYTAGTNLQKPGSLLLIFLAFF